MKFNHLVYVPMTGVGLFNGFRSQEWYKERIEIFKNYTLKSLLNQTNKDFILWLSFRPQEEDNILTLELALYLTRQKIDWRMTFNGLMYWDDKYSSSLRENFKTIKSYWRSRRQGGLRLLQLLWYNKNKDLEERLKKSLFAFENLFKREKKHFDHILLTRIDSDDMFHKDALAAIKVSAILNPTSEAILLNEGYIYNKNVDQLAEWNPNVNSPFHTIKFPSDIFFNAKKHLEYYGSFRTHEDIPYVFNNYNSIPERLFCVLIHANHISTTWNHPFRGKNADKKLLKNFGI